MALRWNIQRGVAVIPESTHRERMAQNMDVRNFRLSDADMDGISKLDVGRSEIVDRDSPGFVRMLHGMRVH